MLSAVRVSARMCPQVIGEARRTISNNSRPEKFNKFVKAGKELLTDLKVKESTTKAFQTYMKGEWRPYLVGGSVLLGGVCGGAYGVYHGVQFGVQNPNILEGVVWGLVGGVGVGLINSVYVGACAAVITVAPEASILVALYASRIQEEKRNRHS